MTQTPSSWKRVCSAGVTDPPLGATGTDELHFHARVQGLNSLQTGNPVRITVDASQVFVFPAESRPIHALRGFVANRRTLSTLMQTVAKPV